MLVAPPLWTGFSPHHLRFGASVSLRADTLLRLLGDVVRTLRDWLPRLVLVNGHGGNRGPLTTLAIEEGCLTVNYWELAEAGLARELFAADLGSIGHAGQAETSMMLAQRRRSSVRPRSPSSRSIASRTRSSSRTWARAACSATRGKATAEAGERFLDAAAAALASYLDHLPTTKEGAP